MISMIVVLGLVSVVQGQLSECLNAEDSSTFQYPEDPAKFYKCHLRQLIAMECPEGQTFNSAMSKCMRKVAPDVDSTLSSECTADHGYVLPNPEDCASFYECAAGRLVLMECPKYLLFNPLLKICDWPWNANCCENMETDKAHLGTSCAN